MDLTHVWHTSDDPGLRRSLTDRQVLELVRDWTAYDHNSPVGGFRGVVDVDLVSGDTLRLVSPEGEERTWKRDVRVLPFSCYVVTQVRPGGVPEDVFVVHTYREALEAVVTEAENALTAYLNAGAPDPFVRSAAENVHRLAARHLERTPVLEYPEDIIGNTPYLNETLEYRSDLVRLRIDRLHGDRAADMVRWEGVGAAVTV